MEKTKADIINRKFFTVESDKIKYIYIIGNGFDIACGLKTSYDNFRTFYLSDTQCDKDDSFICDCKKLIREDIKLNDGLWRDVEARLGTITSDPEYVKRIFHAPQNFLDFYRDMRKSLIRYYSSEENIGKPNFSEVKERECFKNIKIHESIFVVLNYTNTFEHFLIENYAEMYYEEYIRSRILYPHGNVHNRYYEEKILFGVGDRNEIGNRKFRKNKKIIKDVVKHDRYEQLEKLIDWKNRYDWPLYRWDYQLLYNTAMDKGEKLITVYGCSLGIVDTWFWELCMSKNGFPIRNNPFVNKTKLKEFKPNKLKYYTFYTSSKTMEEEMGEFFKRAELTETDIDEKNPSRHPRYNWQYKELFQFCKGKNLSNKAIISIFLMAQQVESVRNASQIGTNFLWDGTSLMQRKRILKKIIEYVYENVDYISVNPSHGYEKQTIEYGDN